MARKFVKDSFAPVRYKPGYIVYVRSGGPEMTIESIEANGDLNCVWFNIGGDKWEPPSRDRFISASVQMAVDGDLIDSRRGRYIDDDGQEVPPKETGLSSLAESAARAEEALKAKRKRF